MRKGEPWTNARRCQIESTSESTTRPSQRNPKKNLPSTKHASGGCYDGLGASPDQSSVRSDLTDVADVATPDDVVKIHEQGARMEQSKPGQRVVRVLEAEWEGVEEVASV